MAEEIAIRVTGQDAFSGTFSRLGATLITLNQTLQLARAAFDAVSGAIASVTSEVAAQADKVGKVSDRLGIATDKLSAYQFAAEQAGVSSETMNMALQRMTRRVAEAAQGSGEAKAAIAELGLNARLLGDATPDQQLRIFAEALGNVESQSDRVRLAFKLFDSEGVSMLQMLKDGAAGLDEMEREAARLGVTISQETARAAAEFNDSVHELNSAVQGLKNSIGEDLLPTATSFNEWLANAIARTRTWYESLGSLIGRVEGLGSAMRSAARMNPILGPLIGLGDPVTGGGGGAGGGGASGGGNPLEGFTGAMEDAVDATEAMFTASQKLAQEFDASVEAWVRVDIAIANNTIALNRLGLAHEQQDAFEAALREEIEKGVITLDNYRDRIDSVRESFEKLIIPAVKLTDTLEGLRDNSEFTFTPNGPPAIPGMNGMDLFRMSGAGGLAGVGGAVSGFQAGGPGGAIAGFFLDLLQRDPKVKKAMEDISAALVKLVGPLAEAISPALEAIAPLLEAMAPGIRVLALAIWPITRAVEAASDGLLYLAERSEQFQWYVDHWASMVELNTDQLQLNKDQLEDLGEEIQRWIDAIRDAAQGRPNVPLANTGTGGPSIPAPSLPTPNLPTVNVPSIPLLTRGGTASVPPGATTRGGITVVVNALDPHQAKEGIMQVVREGLLNGGIQLPRGA